MKKILFSFPVLFIAGFVLLLLLVNKAVAFASPTFPSCTNPQGELIASYESGEHGIVGDYSLHTGKDTVYQISDTTFVQCFCDESGKGIQTDWWKAMDLTNEEIDYFKNEGWMYVESGSDWGLENSPYLAKNTTFDCAACISPTPTVVTPTPSETATPSATPTSQPTNTPTPTPGSSSPSSPSTPGQSGGEVLSSTAPAPVTTLANTGNSVELLFELIAGLFSAGTSIAIKRFHN